MLVSIFFMMACSLSMFFIYHRKKARERQIQKENLVYLLDWWHTAASELPEEELRLLTGLLTDFVSQTLSGQATELDSLLVIKENYPRLFEQMRKVEK